MNLGLSKYNLIGQMDLKTHVALSAVLWHDVGSGEDVCEWSEMRRTWWAWTNTASQTLMDETVMVQYLHSRKQPTINNVTLNVSRDITVNKASSATVISAR